MHKIVKHIDSWVLKPIVEFQSILSLSLEMPFLMKIDSSLFKELFQKMNKEKKWTLKKEMMSLKVIMKKLLKFKGEKELEKQKIWN